ncbi:MAG: hypothetical protein JNL43_03455 [Flavobacteriales bacterium]|nr:hypothetical protein [Flavobacteriales bacterium]
MEYDRPLIRVASLGLLFLSTLVGCRKDPEPARWDVDVLAPLLITRFTIADIIPDSLQDVASDGSITLVYSETLFAVDMDTVLEIPDTSFVYAYALPLPGNDAFNLPAGFPVISENNLIRFDLPDLALSKLVVREGILDLRMKNKMGSVVNGSFDLPGAIFADGSSGLEVSVGPGTATDPAFSSTQRDLAQASFDLRGPFFNEVNTLASSVSAQLDPNGSGATVTNQDSVVITAQYRDLVTQYAKGYFGSRTVTVGPETNGIGLFDNVVSGTLDLDRVRLKIKVENGIGMDLRIRLNSLQAVNTRTGVTVDLEHAIIDGPINLNRALDLGNGFQSSVYENDLDNDDSNVDLFLENMPDQLQYSLDMDLNPLGDISNGNDFLYHDSRLQALLELEVPLDLIATDLVLENIVKPDLPGNEEEQTIQDGTLSLFATNGFPFSGRIVLDIVDRDRNFLSAVPVQGDITAGILGADGFVNASTASELHAALTAEQIDLLYGEGRFRVRIVFNTSDQSQHLRLLDRYAMDLQITVGARYYVNGDE